MPIRGSSADFCIVLIIITIIIIIIVVIITNTTMMKKQQHNELNVSVFKIGFLYHERRLILSHPQDLSKLIKTTPKTPPHFNLYNTEKTQA